MKKILSIFAAMLVAVAVNATVTNISPTSPYENDAVRLALYYSAEGDTIVLAAGTYEESNSDYIAFKRNNVVMAAEGAEVIIKPHVSFRVRGGARAELNGVKIDASELNTLSTSYENIFEVHDNTAGNCWVLKNLEVYGNSAKTMLRHASGKTLDSVIIEGCYIHNNPQAILRLQDASLKGVIIKNSTFAEIANGGSFWCAPIDISTTASDAKVVVDHCTFYHVTSISSSYADVTTGVDGSATSDVTVSNCIIAQPEEYAGSRAINFTNGGTVKNCLVFNYTKSTNGIQGATVEDCIYVDPLFVDAATADYTLGDGSPALNAGDDGSHLGDPRWYPVVAPTFTDFDINFMTDPYTATLPAGVSVAGSFHDAQHGYSSPKVTIPVLAGNYKITIGNCVHSNNDGASIKNADENATLNMINANGQTITSILAKDNCYDQDPTNNFTCVWFVADADQTINVLCPQYTPYFKIEKVDAVPEAKTMYTVSFSAGDAQGVAPAAIEVEAGHAITIPVNRSLYKEGKTLFCWTDGANYYATNTSYLPAGDVELEPIFNDNTVELLNATEEVTVKWMFSKSNGAPSLSLQNGHGNGLIVTQATVGGEKIDVKLDIDANTGKFDNAGRTDEWAQVNANTYFVFPAKTNAVVTTRCYGEPTNSTVDAAAYTAWESNVATYAVNPTAGVSQLANGANTYYSYLQIVLPATATGINNTDAEIKAIKRIENGVLVIEKNGVKYNAQGAIVK